MEKERAVMKYYLKILEELSKKSYKLDIEAFNKGGGQ